MPTTFENYIETAELTDGRNQATEEIPDNAHWDRRNRLFDRIDLRTYVQSLTILSQSKFGTPKTEVVTIIEFDFNYSKNFLYTSIVR